MTGIKLKKKFFSRKINHDDKIMVDRGFNISVILGRCGAQLVIPFLIEAKKQVSPGDVEFTRRIANVRILVARVIGSIRQIFLIR